MGEFVTVADGLELGDGELARFEIDGKRLAVANVGGSLHAFDDTCTHAGCSLAQGALEGVVVTCPCHRSQFDVTTGEVLRGPAQEPVQSYPARTEGQALQIEM